MTRMVFVLIILSSAQCFGWDGGFDFRASQSFVVDPTYAIFASNALYPTTSSVNGQQITYGWESQTGGYLTRDRVSTIDPRLAGMSCQVNDGTISVFRVDLPSTGAYNLGVAVGDAVYDESNYVKVSSSSSTLLTLNTPTSGGFFADASGTIRDAASWPGLNATVQKIFGATILRLALGGVVDSGFSCVAHLRITTAQAGAAHVPNLSFLIN